MHGSDVCNEKKSIMPLIADSMRAYGDMPALCCEEKSYKYKDVDRLSSQLAAYLRRLGLKKGDVVSVLVPRCEYMSIAPLGILRAGGAYQPLDPSYPAERLKFMIEDADAPVIIVSKALVHLIESVTGEGAKREILYMEDIPNLPEADEAIWEEAGGEDPFVILYTSGTTGVPKGIILTHGNIYSACKWHLDYYGVDANCRMGQHPSFVFDLAIVELILPLTAGASIYIIPEEIRTDLKKLNDFLEKNGITHLTMTTQLGRQFAQTVSNKSLRHLTVGGEALISVCPPEGYMLHNDYGPAECTLYTTIFPVKEEYTGKVPIGRAVDEVRLYVVDEKGQEVPEGEIGELWIAGPHVALGYLNRPELTAKSFMDNPFSDEPDYKRVYKSGDLVIRHEDGLLEFMGRADRQVKIRGIRIEPAEIEELLRKYEGIDEVVISTPEIGGQRVIAAYYLAEKELDTKAMEDFVLKNKPSYMCPSFFTRISSIPLNTNGKVDYGKLPIPDFGSNKAVYEEPVTDTEKVVAAIYEEVLGIEKVGRNDDFMRIGGNSLLAMQLLYEVDRKLSCSLRSRDVMDNSVVSELASLIDKRLEEGEDAGFAQIRDALIPEREYYPVSKAQERIYTAQKLLNKGDLTYLLGMTIETEGRLDRAKVEDALYKLFARHESLRTSFHMQGSEILQKIEPAKENRIRSAVQNAYRDGAPEAFVLEEAPLFWWSFGEGRITFYWHHIVNDGTGMSMFGKEFAALYNGEELRGMTIHQKEYAAWEQDWMASDSYRKCIENWTELIADCAECRELRLPYDGRHRDSNGAKAGHFRLEIGAGETNELEKICRDQGITPYVYIFTAFSLLLYKYSGMKKFLLGTAVDGRQQRNTASLQGMFANTLPVPVTIEEEMSFNELLASARDKILFMLDNRQASLEDIAEDYEDLGGLRRTAHGHQLFDVFFVMRDFDSKLPDMEGSGAKLYWPYDEMPMYDLTLEAGREKEFYYFVFEYDKDLFDEESISWMGRHFENLLKSCLQIDTGLVSDVSMTDQEEKKLFLDHSFGAVAEFKADTILDRVGQQAKNHPDKAAVVFKDSYLTYSRLWEASGAIAGKLLKEYTGEDMPKKERWVGIIADRSLAMIAGIFGIMRSGAGYVPISPEYPKERISFMLEDCKADAVLECGVDIDISADIPVIHMYDKELFREDSQETECPELPMVEPSQNAYMIFTSGSTGEPKGVVVEHAQLSALLDSYRNIYELDASDTVLQFANFVFDQSVWDIFHILSVGGSLCLIPGEIVRDPERLSDYCQEKGVTVASLTPGFLRLMDPEKLPKLRLLDVGGEAPDYALLKAWSRGRTVFNTYGPTETTVNATSFRFSDKGRDIFKARENKENVPIGTAVPGTRVYILEGNKLSGIGVPGELCIAGRQVTRGYRNRQELTDEKYVQDPFVEGRMYRSGDLARMLPDGNIEFIGRMDDQVKLRGYRIELGEIESALRGLEAVKDAAVIIRKDENDVRQLCGYYVPENGDISGKGIREIRQQLEKRLPIYMVPSALVPLSKFKLTLNGKIDRRALPCPVAGLAEDEENESSLLPETREERDCLEAFEEVLNIKDMKATDDFLSWGGDSIKAIMVVSILRKKGYSVNAGMLLKCRTARALGPYLKPEEQKEYTEFDEVIPTPIMRMFTQAKMVNPAYYAQSALFDIRETADVEAIKEALEELVRYHGMLRMVLDNEGNIRIRNKEELGTIELPVYSDISAQEKVKIMGDISASLDPSMGRVMGAALLLSEKGDQLFLTFHHYVIDEVSWEILTGDLNALYKKESLPPRTVSFGEWSKALWQYKESMEFISEKDYWNKVYEEVEGCRVGYCGLLKSFMQYEAPKDRKSLILVKDIDKAGADRLISLSRNRYSARPDAILAAFLVRTLGSKYGAENVLFQMESHGRGNIGEDLNCDRTVGWFTSVYPMLIPVLADMDRQILEIKEEMALVPNYGLGYGLLHENLVEIGGFVFNYLGDSRSSRENLIEYSSEYAGPESDARNVDPGTISVNIRSVDTGLQIECVYDNIYSEDKVRGLIDEYATQLESWLSGDFDNEKILSPSDFCVSEIMSLRDFDRLSVDIDPKDIEAIGPLTPLQKGMLYRLYAEPETGAYMQQDKLLLKGDWNKDAFCKALELSFVRFDALRTRFAINGYEKTWQIILREGTICAEYKEISGQTLEEIAASDLKRGFDPEKDVLLRVTFNRDSENDDNKEFLVSSHHSILDGWSFRILTDTVMDYYYRLCEGGSCDSLREEAVKEASRGLKYSEYLRLTGNKESEAVLSKWDGYLKGINEGAGFGQPGENGGKAAFSKLPITGEKEKNIRKYAETNKVTLSSFFSTVFGLLLGFENDGADILFGETVSGRNINAEGVEKAVGMFINTIPVRIKWEADTPVSELMKKRQEDYLMMQPFENAPLDRIMTRKKAGSGLIKTLYVYENYPADEEDDRYSITMQHEEVDYPLSVSIEEQEGFSLEIQYDSGCYEKSYIECLMGRFDNLITQITSDENIRISELERIPEREKKLMLSELAGTDVEFPPENFPEMLLRSIKENPSKDAVIMDGRSLSYEQLWRASLALAKELGFGEERYVAVYADRSLGMIVALIATFIAGAAYVPLDPDFPDERVQFILSDCEPVAVLRSIIDGTPNRNELFKNACDKIIDIDVDELLQKEISEDLLTLPIDPEPDRLAYMIYTSGTTGKPKGVEIEHRALTEMIYSNRSFYGDVFKVVLQLANYVFDASVYEIFIPLAYGGTLCMIPKDKLKSSEAMAKYCRDNRVRLISSTNAFLQALDPDKFSRFDGIVVGGDAANSDAFAKWAENTDLMVNDYGPTEACVNALAYRYTKGYRGPIPIGRPYENKKVYILQKDRLCGILQKGEICIGGKGLARGYHNREELNAKAFVINPYTGERMYRTGDVGYFAPNGDIFCLGRYDDQVKIRGYRIETGEIESRIREYSSIREAAVIKRADNGREAYLAAYITADEAMNTDMLKAYLKKKLPAFMVPAAIVQLDSLPRNASDKLDLEALPIPEFSEHTAAPEGYLEELIAALFEKILGLGKVGRDDSFFELGGSSLDLMRLISEISQYDISIADVTLSPTPRLMGLLLQDKYRGIKREDKGIYILKSGREDIPALFCLPPSGGMSLCYLPLIKEMDYEGQVYGLTDSKYAAFAGMTLEELMSGSRCDDILWDETIENYYRAVETLFKDEDILIGYSQGGPVAFEVAKKLEDKGHKVGRVIMLDAPRPGVDYGQESRPEMMATAAAIFAGKTDADITGFDMTDETTEEAFFRKYLKENFGDKADKELLHSIFETYLVYSSNVSNKLEMAGTIQAPIDSAELGGKGVSEENPWSKYSESEGRAYVFDGPAKDHLAFLSKYRKELAKVVSGYIRRA